MRPTREDGIRTEILICDPGDVGEPQDPVSWGGDAPRLAYEDVDNGVLAGLWRSLNGAETAASLDGTDLLVWPDADPLVFRLPDDLTSRLGSLHPKEADAVARRWAEDMRAEGLTVDAARAGLSALSGFVRWAAEARRALVLVMYV